jgi:uncharacterized protein YqeY
MIYEKLKTDMTAALKANDKNRRLTLADIVATIDKAAIAGKTRIEITDELCNEVLTKYKKTVQEMIDTCPKTEAYIDRLEEYKEKMIVVKEYAPRIIEDSEEIKKIIISVCEEKNISLSDRSSIKVLMPALKSAGCDMKVAQSVIKSMSVS